MTALPALAVFAMVPLAGPQGDQLSKLFESLRVPAELAPVSRATPAGSLAFVLAAEARGIDAAEFAVTRLAIPKEHRTPVGILRFAARLRDARSDQRMKRNPEVRRLRFSRVKDIERFFTLSHRAMRKALGLEPNLALTTPEFHALIERVQTDPDYRLGKADQRILKRERSQIKRIDMTAMLSATLEVVAAVQALTEARVKLLALPTEAPRQAGVTGRVLFERDTPFGRFVIGGAGRNTYDCNRVAVIVDIGGDDEYQGAAGGADEERRFSVCIDLDGTDVYRCGAGALGSATYGLGVCIDVAGDDVYEAGARSAGCGIAGVGVFIDLAGADKLTIGDTGGGVGMYGIGICADLGGKDQQRGGSGAFGVGLPGGVGLFVDARGIDKRGLTGAAGHSVFGFGAALGFGGAKGKPMPSGLGVCLDFEGDDSYAAGDFALGVGDRGGYGVCVDFKGDDTYITKGLGLGSARRRGRGMMFDVAGKDHYFASEGLGVAMADSVAWFIDRSGDDIYEVFGAGMGWAGKAATGLFQDLGGANRFRFQAQKLRLLPVRGAGGVSLFRTRGVGDVFRPANRNHATWPAAKVARELAQGRLFVRK